MVYENIVRYCEEHGISIAAFERMCGLGNAVVAAWKDEHGPTLSSLLKIEKATGISISEWVRKHD